MLLPDYEELSEKEETLEKNEAFIEKAKKTVSDTENDISKTEEEITSLTNEAKALEHTGEERLQLKNEKDTLLERSSKLNALQGGLSSLEQAEEEYRSALEIYKEKQALANEKEYAYKTQSKLYFDSQAGILADTLEDGKPCPVCGSLSHPSIAKKPENAPEKEELEELQKEVDKVNDSVSSAREHAGKLKGTLEERRDSVSAEINALLGDYTPTEAKLLTVSSLTEISQSIKELSDKIIEAERKAKRREEIEGLIPNKRRDIELLRSRLLEIQDGVKTKAVENATIEKRISELRTRLIFETPEQANGEIATLTAAADKITKELNEAQERLNQSRERLASLKAAKEEIVKRLKDGADINPEAEAQRQAELEKELGVLEGMSKVIHSRITTNTALLENVKAKSGNLVKVEKRYAWVKKLSTTANGQITGKTKIMLETYIQTHYFDKIINRANKRLRIMTDNQYDLVRRTEPASKSGQSGLELDVIDHYNGTKRSVGSLSGGESFKASLALALGLSDEIQSSAGGIRLDTMFVDEGFGSLDEESLEAAMKALRSLADGERLVGIISHVAELKRSIGNKIVVTKDKSGGSRAEIIIE